MLASTKPTISSTYEIAQRTHFHKDRPQLLTQRKKSTVSLNELPPTPDSESDKMSSPAAIQKEDERFSKHLRREDKSFFSSTKTQEQKELARKRSQYYDETFAIEGTLSVARERASRESMVMAVIRTNVIIQDEYTFITDLSSFLSARYQRPESNIIVAFTHSTCLLFGGSFDPAYTMSITALPSLLQPTTNLRNTILIQRHLSSSLGPPPERGLITFAPIPEDNLAVNSKTIAGQIQEFEKEMADDKENTRKSLARNTPNTTRRYSTKSIQNMKAANTLPTHRENTPPMSESDTPPLPSIPSENSSMDRTAEKAKRVGRRKSFIASMFGRGG